MSLEILLDYMGISETQFTAVEEKYFDRLTELLFFHKIIKAGERATTDNFTDLIKNFQATVMLDPNPDGVPGEQTLWALQRTWAPSRGLYLVKKGIPFDDYGHSGIGFRMRSDIVDHFKELFAEVQGLGAKVTSSGSLRDIFEMATDGRSPTSMHYTGIAFDLNIESGMQDLSKNVYYIERAGVRRWQVWGKVSAPKGDLRSISAILYSEKNKDVSVILLDDRVIDFTGTAKKHGFIAIGNRSDFPEKYISAEWWHFQCEEVLVQYISQFGTELLTIYSEDEIKKNPNVWNHRLAIFGKNWH